MSTDIVCIGVCINDPDTGTCLGCGRGPVEVSGVAAGATDAAGNPSGHPTGIPVGHKKSGTTPLSAAQYPLPPQVADQLENSSD